MISAKTILLLLLCD